MPVLSVVHVSVSWWGRGSLLGKGCEHIMQCALHVAFHMQPGLFLP